MNNLVAPDELPARAGKLLADGFRVALIAAHDDRPQGVDRLRATYVFTAPDPDRRVELHVALPPDAPRVPSLAELSFPAGRLEREMHDLFGIVPVDHPLPRRLVRHFHWPRGWYPMRSDAGAPPEFSDVDGPYPFGTVEGPGVYEIPVGPVHAGMIGPGHFRFSVVGETVLNLKARLWFTHRGVESTVVGRRPEDALEIAERIAGDTSVGHALAFCLAIEDATGSPTSPRTRRDRAVLLELERIHNHVADLGALCRDVGYGILDVHAARLRERLLRLHEDVTGHRLLRGAVRPGRTALRRPPDLTALAEIGDEVAELAALALDHSVVRDRFTDTAVLSTEAAAELGTLGYVARASGLSVDARHDHPFVAWPLPRTVPTRTRGDVLARFLVRAQEAAESVAAIAALADTTPSAAVDARDPEGTSGLGIVEGWRGTLVHRVELGADGRLTRLKIVDPSFMNWPALPTAMADTIVADFPLANKSFDQSYPGNDL